MFSFIVDPTFTDWLFFPCHSCSSYSFSLLFSIGYKGQFRFVSLQSKIGKSLLLRCGKQPDDISSIVLIEKQTTDVSATSSAESQQQQQQQSKVDGTVTTDILPIIAYYKSDAVLRIARKLDSGLWIFPSLIGVLGPLVPKFMRNVVYEFVAQNRYNFGHRLSILRDYYGDNTSCRLEDDRYDDRFIPDP